MCTINVVHNFHILLTIEMSLYSGAIPAPVRVDIHNYLGSRVGLRGTVNKKLKIK